MRLTRYKNVLEEAKELPTSMSQSVHVVAYYDPQRRYVQFILQLARMDEKLFHSEFVELYELSQQLMRKAKGGGGKGE